MSQKVYIVAQVYGGVLNDLWAFNKEQEAKDFARILQPEPDFDSERDDEDNAEGGYDEIIVESNILGRREGSERILTLASGR